MGLAYMTAQVTNAVVEGSLDVRQAGRGSVVSGMLRSIGLANGRMGEWGWPAEVGCVAVLALSSSGSQSSRSCFRSGCLSGGCG